MTTDLDAFPLLRFTAEGLIPAIAVDHETGSVLMMAWMNRESLAETIQSGRTCYFSRSRQKLWRKGETSGHHQEVIEIRTDCDQDVLLIRVRQQGAACHEGTFSCFTRIVENNGSLTCDGEVIARPGKE